MSRPAVWIGFLCFILGSSVASADETLMKIDWEALKKNGKLSTGTVEGSGADAVLRVSSDKTEPMTLELTVLEAPKITAKKYALRGRVRHEGVEGEGYLEMWSHYGEERFFTRTLAGIGALKHLKGTSDGREFVLPFMTSDDRSAPNKLEFNVVLPGKGTIWLESVNLVQFDPWEDPLAVPGAWWSDQMAGLVFGSLGGLLGLLGGLVGMLCWLGKGRGMVMAILWVMTAGGLASLVAGVFALIQGQPYGVVYPLLLMGTIASAVAGGNIRGVRKKFQDLELRRMSAMDAGRA